MEKLLQELVRTKGLDYFREGKFFVNAVRELGCREKDVTLLLYLVETGGHLELLDAKNLSAGMQQARYVQVVKTLCDRTLISEELAHQVCAAFWQAIYQKDPPVIWEPLAPTPQETPDELFQRGCSCLQQDKPEKEEEAVKWFRKAAELGHAEAQLYLGYRLMDGIGTPVDQVEGLSWFHRAAAGGKIEAHNHIGCSYFYGTGVEQDHAQAAYWYRKGADLGDPWAMNNLSLLYETGDGVEKNLEQALFWCRKSAQLGHTGAQERLPRLEQLVAPPPPPPKPRGMIHNKFYITKQEALNGGPIRVYLPEGGYEVHTLPAKVRDMQYVDPIAYNIKIGYGWDKNDDILRASDGRLIEAEKMKSPFGITNLEGLLLAALMSIGLYCLSPVFQLLLFGLDWLLNCVGLDILNTSGTVSLVLPYCTLVFHSLRDVTVELGWPDTLLEWMGLIVFWYPLFLYIFISIEEWKTWWVIQRELERRSKL